MKDSKLKVQFNKKISGGVYHMSLGGDCSEISRPGQFIDILIDDYYLRRPISIFDHDDEHVEILYRVVGGGTEALAVKAPGDELDVLLPLGNGFDLKICGKRNLLVAGGIGMPPIHEIAKLLKRSDAGSSEASGIGAGAGEACGIGAGAGDVVASTDFRVLLGFRSADDIFGIDSFRSLGIEPVIATEDGSVGVKGLVTDVMDMMKAGAADHESAEGRSYQPGAGAGDDRQDNTGELGFDYDYVFCCGPEPMLKAVYEHTPDGQFSFEERMGCGFGACMGCSCETKYGYKRICRDGPILFRDEILW